VDDRGFITRRTACCAGGGGSRTHCAADRRHQQGICDEVGALGRLRSRSKLRLCLFASLSFWRCVNRRGEIIRVSQGSWWSWRGPGGPREAPRSGFGRLLAALGMLLSALGHSRPLLGCSWPLLGCSWAALGHSWPALGHPRCSTYRLWVV